MIPDVAICEPADVGINWNGQNVAIFPWFERTDREAVRLWERYRAARHRAGIPAEWPGCDIAAITRTPERICTLPDTLEARAFLQTRNALLKSIGTWIA